MLRDDDRLEIYIGNTAGLPNEIILDENIETFLALSSINFDTFWRAMRAYPNG